MTLPEIIERLTARAFHLEQRAFSMEQRAKSQSTPDTEKFADAQAMRAAARLIGGIVEHIDPILLAGLTEDIWRLEDLNDQCTSKSCSGCLSRRGKADRLRRVMLALTPKE